MAYQEVNISELEPGSYVVQVLKQSGDITVKHAGWVNSQEAIATLQKKGVIRVLIDPAKKLSQTEKTTNPSVKSESSAAKHLFDDELPKADKALRKVVQTQEQVLNAVQHEQQVDLTLVYEVSAGLAHTVNRNPDVTLYLNRLANQGHSLLEHSINCAVYMAAFAKNLQLPIHTSEALISAALLHDVGKLFLNVDDYGKDHLAISYSLNALQKTAHLAGEISLWISQHCAYLDGSGSPKIAMRQIERGSRMLSIVNQFANLTSNNNIKLSVRAAAKELLARTPHQLDDTLVQQFIKCIGIYPPGSVVKLTSGKLALVLENNVKKPLQPKVKVFYHSIHQHHLPAKIIDLAHLEDELITQSIDLKKFGLDIRNYI